MITNTGEFIVFPELVDRLCEHKDYAWDLLILIAFLVRETYEQKTNLIRMNSSTIKNKFSISKVRCSKLIKILSEYWFIKPIHFRDDWKISWVWFLVILDYNLFF